MSDADSEAHGSIDYLDEAITEIWNTKIAPAVVEIEDELSYHSLLKEIARSASQSARDMVVSGAALSISIDTLARIAVRRHEVAKSDLYYLYEMGRAAKQATD